jgi:hypothetical protein
MTIENKEDFFKNLGQMNCWFNFPLTYLESTILYTSTTSLGPSMFQYNQGTTSLCLSHNNSNLIIDPNFVCNQYSISRLDVKGWNSFMDVPEYFFFNICEHNSINSTQFTLLVDSIEYFEQFRSRMMPFGTHISTRTGSEFIKITNSLN